ncbi:RIP metalloprotease RseP, partial [bacterium]|nr:RIP metalloprotease RseP [bacterium]
MFETIFGKIISLLWVFGPAVLVLGFLIFIHELGHFLAARFVGIRVEVFSIGFGKRLIGFRRGATDYRLSIFPFGGYVRMAGEELPGQSEGEEDISESDKISAQYAKPGDTLNEKPVPHRLLVTVAGAAMNAVVAVLLTIGLAYFGIQIDAYLMASPVIAHIQSDSSAAKAGFEKGDLIVSVAEKKVTTWEEAQQELLMNLGKPVSIEVERQSNLLSAEITINQDEAFQFGGIGTPSKVIIGLITPESPAAKADLQKGDHITFF